MPKRDILLVSGVKQGLFTARSTPRFEYEVADARNNSLTPPGRVCGPTHRHLRGNERNSRSPPAHHSEASRVSRVPHQRTETPGRVGVSSVYILRPQVVLKRSQHTRIETNNSQSILENFSLSPTHLDSTTSLPLTSSHYTVVLPLARFARSWPNPKSAGIEDAIRQRRYMFIIRVWRVWVLPGSWPWLPRQPSPIAARTAC